MLSFDLLLLTSSLFFLLFLLSLWLGFLCNIFWVSELKDYASHVVGASTIRHGYVTLCYALIHHFFYYERSLSLGFELLHLKAVAAWSSLLANLEWRTGESTGLASTHRLLGFQFGWWLGGLRTSFPSLSDEFDGLLVGEAIPDTVTGNNYEIVFWF